MSFLAPLALLLAAAAAVPLLVHLLRRRIGTRIEFPAARYLARAEQEHSRNLRLRNLLLMLLRVAVVLALALAAARPVGRMLGSGHAPTAIAIVLDNSLSATAVVGGRPVLDELRELAAAVARRASAADRLWLVTADGAVVGGDAAAVAAAVERVTPLAGAGRLPDALLRAAELVRGDGRPDRVIAVLTDAQATAWRAPVTLGDAHVIVYRPAAAPPANRAVVSADGRPSHWTPRGALAARLLGADSVTYRITLGDRTLARGTAARDEELVVRAAPPERGWTAGAVELQPDELRGDDVRHFAVWIGPPPAVRADPAAGPFVESAVGALQSAGRVVAGNGLAVAPADVTARLPALLLAPSDPVRLGAANRALERLGVPWRFGAPRRGAGVVRGGDAGRSLDGVTVALRYPLLPQAGTVADTLARVDAQPWVVAGDRYVLVGSPLDVAATTLPLRATFVPWLGDLLAERLAGAAGAVLPAAPGATVRRPLWADGLEAADGTRRALAGGSVEAPARAGVYFLTRAGARVGALVVNPEAEESVLDRVDDAALASRVRATDVRVMTDGARFARSAFGSAAQRPLAGLFLAGALLALLLETLLLGAGARTDAPRAGATGRAAA